VREALHRVGGELVDVGEDRVGQRAEDVGRQLGAEAGVRQSPPRHPGPDPVRGLQRVQAASFAHLAAAQAAVDLPSLGAAEVGVGHQIHELAQRFLHAQPDAAAEVALERPRVLRHLLGDPAEDRVEQRRHLGLDHQGDLGRQRAPGFVLKSAHLRDKNPPQLLGYGPRPLRPHCVASRP
jgi:hypothetical protein